MPERPICFVIAPLSKAQSEIRVRSDLVLKHVITPVADECGYDVERADKISETGMITTQVINHILNDAMVVADLTGHNANVFYELAVRHAAQKPFVQIIESGELPPFDVAGLRTVDFDHKNLDSVEEGKNQLKKHMKAVAANIGRIETPISSAIDFDKLNRSDDPAKRQLADILATLADMKALIEQRLPTSPAPGFSVNKILEWERLSDLMRIINEPLTTPPIQSSGIKVPGLLSPDRK